MLSCSIHLVQFLVLLVCLLKLRMQNSLHHPEAYVEPKNTPTNETAACLIDGNVSLNVLSPMPDYYHGAAEITFDRLLK